MTLSPSSRYLKKPEHSPQAAPAPPQHLFPALGLEGSPLHPCPGRLPAKGLAALLLGGKAPVRVTFFFLYLPQPFLAKPYSLATPTSPFFYLQPLVSSRPSHDSTRANLLKQRFSNLTARQNHLGSIFKHRLLGSASPPEFLIQ